jgi:hypothetical protein
VAKSSSPSSSFYAKSRIVENRCHTWVGEGGGHHCGIHGGGIPQGITCPLGGCPHGIGSVYYPGPYCGGVV